MAQLITFVLVASLCLLLHLDIILARDAVDEYDDYQYNDSEYNYPDFGLKRANVKLSTIKTVVTEKKFTPFIQPKLKYVTSPSKKSSTTTTTTTTSTTTTPRPSTTTSRRPYKPKRYRTSTTEKPYSDESNSFEEPEEDAPIPPRAPKTTKSKTRTTTTAPRHRKHPLANSGSNRNEIKINPNLTSSYVDFYAENNDYGDRFASLHNIIKPNEYSFQFHHPHDYTTEPQLHSFSPEVHSPRHGSHGNEINYFKPILSTSTQSTTAHKYHANRGSFKPVHIDFETDLNLAELPLESVPGHLNSFRHPTRKEPTEYESAEYHNHNHYSKEPPPIHLYETSEFPTHTKYSTSFKHTPDHFNHHTSNENKPYFRPSSQFHGHHSVDYVPASPVASQEQVDHYNNDLREFYEAAIEKQLKNSKNPADRAKYHQFLKAKHDEKIEQQQSKRQPPVPSYRNRNRPTGHHAHAKPRKPHPRPFTTPGLRHFRNPQLFADRSYEFPFV